MHANKSYYQDCVILDRRQKLRLVHQECQKIDLQKKCAEVLR
jgi:hypothetical protein